MARDPGWTPVTLRERPRSLILLATLGVVLAAGIYLLSPGPSDRAVPPGTVEAAPSCTTCDARHRNLGDRRDAVQKLMGSGD